MERMSKREPADAGHVALSEGGLGDQDQRMSIQLAAIPTGPDATTGLPEIIGGPTPIQAPRPGDTYRWKVQHGRAEKHVYVQIAPALRAEAFEDPLRSGIETKGESVLVK